MNTFSTFIAHDKLIPSALRLLHRCEQCEKPVMCGECTPVTHQYATKIHLCKECPIPLYMCMHTGTVYTSVYTNAHVCMCNQMHEFVCVCGECVCVVCVCGVYGVCDVCVWCVCLCV